jgi:outer membrane protein assembly factor BamB
LGTALDKAVDDFRNKKLFDLGFSDPEKIEFHDGAKVYFLTKGGSDWFSGDGKKVDSIGSESFVEKVRDLAASKFVDAGFGTTELEVTATSNSGKSVEKIVISKNGDHYVAKRDGEPALYQLDAVAVTGLEKAAADMKPAVEPKPEATSKKK